MIRFGVGLVVILVNLGKWVTRVTRLAQLKKEKDQARVRYFNLFLIRVMTQYLDPFLIWAWTLDSGSFASYWRPLSRMLRFYVYGFCVY